MNGAFLFLLTFIAAFCSLTYELILAQVLAATLGGTLLRFCTVVGLFSLTLGLGALFFGRKERALQARLKILFYVELGLAAIGLLGPLIIVALDPYRSDMSLAWILEGFFYLPVIAIGFLSGYELPLLLSLCRNRRDELQTLASDYLGMFAGSLMVPFVIYPFGGPFVGSMWMGILNILAAGLVLPYLRREARVYKWGVGSLASIFLLAVVLLMTQKHWLDWMSSWFIA